MSGEFGSGSGGGGGSYDADGILLTPMIHRWGADHLVYNDAGTTLATDTQTVQEWHDQIGSWHLTQSTSGFRPVYKVAQQNGLPIISLDGVDDTILSGTVSSPSDHYTVFFVWKLRTWVSNHWLFSFASSMGLICDSSAGTPAGRYTSGAGFLTSGVPADLKVGACSVLEMKGWDPDIGLDCSSRTDAGSKEDAGNVMNPISSATVEFGAGSNRGGGASSSLDIAEILFYDGTLSNTDSDSIRAALITKWGV
jgi:hypothetical protein